MSLDCEVDVWLAGWLAGSVAFRFWDVYLSSTGLALFRRTAVNESCLAEVQCSTDTRCDPTRGMSDTLLMRVLRAAGEGSGVVW